jgi:hypothetical protein
VERARDSGGSTPIGRTSAACGATAFTTGRGLAPAFPAAFAGGRAAGFAAGFAPFAGALVAGRFAARGADFFAGRAFARAGARFARALGEDVFAFFEAFRRDTVFRWVAMISSLVGRDRPGLIRILEPPDDLGDQADERGRGAPGHREDRGDVHRM